MFSRADTPEEATPTNLRPEGTRSAFAWQRFERWLSARARILLLLSLVAALVAQSQLDSDRDVAVAVGLYLAAAVLFGLLFGRVSIESSSYRRSQPSRRIRWELVAGAALLGGLSFPRFSGNAFSPEGMTLWGAGFVFLVLALHPGLKSPRAPLPERAHAARVSGGSSVDPLVTRDGVLVSWHHAALLGAILAGAFYRLYRVDTIHQEMGCDLPHIYNNIRYVLRSEYLIFFPSYPGREGLFFYLAAPFCKAFGLTHTSIKMASASIGVLTIPAIYLLGMELYDREVGLWSAYFLAISRWHITLTRMGYRMCTMPLALVLTLFFLVRAFRTSNRWYYALAGLCLGLGLYTYNAFMIVPGLVAVAFLAMLLSVSPAGGSRRARAQAHLGGFALLVLVSAYTVIPLARYAYENPDAYTYRAATRITDLETAMPVDLAGQFVENMVKVAGMFNYRGDGLSIFNVPFSRHLSLGTAILFVLGVGYAVRRWRNGQNATVLLTLGSMMLPSALSLAFPNEVPNAGRAIGTVPAIALLAAVSATLLRRRAALELADGRGAAWRLMLARDDRPAIDWSVDWAKVKRYALAGLLAVLVVSEAAGVYSFYFGKYVPGLPESDYSISLNMARAIDDFADDGESYIKTHAYWYDGNAVRAQLRETDQSWHNEIAELHPSVPPMAGPPGKFMLILHPQDVASLETLRAAFPRGIDLTHKDNRDQVAFISFYGER